MGAAGGRNGRTLVLADPEIDEVQRPCAADPDAWFPSSAFAEYDAAYVCQTECPAQVRDACRRMADAYEANPSDSWGVWGGETREQRIERRRKEARRLRQLPEVGKPDTAAGWPADRDGRAKTREQVELAAARREGGIAS